MIDLEGMSRSDLVKLRADVDKAIAGVADREKRAALKAAEELAAEGIEAEVIDLRTLLSQG